MKVKQTSCRYCGQNIEAFSPYRKGTWRDRGNNTTCPYYPESKHNMLPPGPNVGKPHAPYIEQSR